MIVGRRGDASAYDKMSLSVMITFARNFFLVMAFLIAVGSLASAQEPGELAWSLDPAELHVPDSPVRGRMTTCPSFLPSSIRQYSHTLEFEQGDFTHGNWKMIIDIPKFNFTEEAENIRLREGPEKGNDRIKTPSVRLSWRTENGLRYGNEDFKGGFVLLLETGTMTDGAVPARIYVCLPDESKSLLAGTFSITGPSGKPLVLTKISGSLKAPAVINEEALYIGSAGSDSKGNTTVAGSHLRMGKDGEFPKGPSSTSAGSLGFETHFADGSSSYTLRGRPPGWHLVILAAARRSTEPSPSSPARPPGFLPFPEFDRFDPVPRIYDLRWVELKDVRATAECDLTLDPARLGSAVVTVPGVRDGAVVTFLPVTPDAPDPLPGVDGASPWMRSRVKEGVTDKITLPQGTYDFQCVGRKQRVKIEPHKTARVKLTEKG